MERKIVYFDMDNVLVDFKSAFKLLSESTLLEYEGRLDEIPGIFSLMKPMEGALEAFEEIAQLSDAYILSTAPWNNPSAWSDKLLWVQKHLKESSYKRLILSHHKNLNRGDILIDDRKKNGADKFKGIFIHFGSEQFPHWKRVKKYVLTLL